MLKYIILCLCINLSCVLCDLNKTLGSKCEWDGLQGQYVKESKCISTLDKRSPPHPVVFTKGKDKIICCTDCGFVNNTRNAVFSPIHLSIFWKDGKDKARDNCLQYNKDLPYSCKSGGFYTGIRRYNDVQKNCSLLNFWGIGGSPPINVIPGAQYPHQVLLGYGDDLKTAWLAGGTLISDKYILTAAHVNYVEDKQLTYVALDFEVHVPLRSKMQTYKIKRFIPAPEYQHPYKYHDIALIETETRVKFSLNVLPACLHVEEADDFMAVATTWKDNSSALVDTIQTTILFKSSGKKCKGAHGPSAILPKGIDITTQMCYSTTMHGVCESWKVLLGYSYDNLEMAEWLAEGKLIIGGYIRINEDVTHYFTIGHISKWLKYVALGVRNHSDSSFTWQIHNITYYKHIDSQKHNLYKILTETPENFNCDDVLPAKDDEAVATSSRDLESKDNSSTLVDTIQNQTGLFGQPLLIDTQFDSCVYAVIGVKSFGDTDQSDKPNVYTRVAPYVPWIESIVWP